MSCGVKEWTDCSDSEKRFLEKQEKEINTERLGEEAEEEEEEGDQEKEEKGSTRG